MQTITWVLSLLLLVQIIFQIMLAAGAPYGHISYGGGHSGRLPNNFRIASAISVLVYCFFLSIVLAEEFTAIPYSTGFIRIVLWVMVIFFSLGTIANVASRSKPERLWAFYTIVTLICILYQLDVL